MKSTTPPRSSRHPSKTNTTSRKDRHQEPINTNIMNMNETNLQEKKARKYLGDY